MGKYGWTARQYARVNARREARGQELLDIGQVGPNWMDAYTKEYAKRTGKSAFEENPEKPKRRFPETDEDETKVASAKKPLFRESRMEYGKDVKMKPVESEGLNRMASRNEELRGRRMREQAMRGPALIGRSMGMMA